MDEGMLTVRNDKRVSKEILDDPGNVRLNLEKTSVQVLSDGLLRLDRSLGPVFEGMDISGRKLRDSMDAKLVR